MPRKPKLEKQTIAVIVNGTPVAVTLFPPTDSRKSWYAYWTGLVASKSTGHRKLADAVVAALGLEILFIGPGCDQGVSLLIVDHLRVNVVQAAEHGEPRPFLRASDAFADALASCEAALRLKPNTILALYNRGNILRELQRPEEALRELQRQGPVPMEEGEWPRYFYGTPERVRAQLAAFAGALDLDEVIAVTIVHDHAARLRSYELLASAAEGLRSGEVPRLATVR